MPTFLFRPVCAGLLPHQPKHVLGMADENPPGSNDRGHGLRPPGADRVAWVPDAGRAQGEWKHHGKL